MVYAWLCPQCGNEKIFPPDLRARCFKCGRTAQRIFRMKLSDGAGPYRQSAWACGECGGQHDPPDFLTTLCIVCDQPARNVAY